MKRRILFLALVAALCSVAISLAIIPLHEFGHYLAARILGIDGHITVDLIEYTGSFVANIDSLTYQEWQFIESGSLIFPAIIFAGPALLLVKFIGKQGNNRRNE